MISHLDIGGSNASSTKCISLEFLSKIWSIDPKEAGRTIDVTSKYLRRPNDPKFILITQQMITHSGTAGYVNTSSWIHYLLQRRLASLHPDIPVCNYLWQTRDLFT